jgi:hypothetical protein
VPIVGIREVLALVALVVGGSAVISIALTYMFWRCVSQLLRMTGESDASESGR